MECPKCKDDTGELDPGWAPAPGLDPTTKKYFCSKPKCHAEWYVVRQSHHKESSIQGTLFS